ncbi:hypothetical protein [Deinococcus cellulosilyticus]|uniref:Uncharacterized protein n=1 Tax=Deinococcus cellulosilyticus (strain DSM 18568 / NBRC 106333 / KACC 11606 / 5516J-15) TaxID=1223518 RepID=A0A511N2W3_DEIC1|nr:hypothetical protein [Deinococcus cellulosilyticus]GEM47195.1 hypothetical protein DC3_28300 [Deinococcus cellulosilyticus NBRC 106333 = KACC 11606]
MKNLQDAVDRVLIHGDAFNAQEVSQIAKWLQPPIQDLEDLGYDRCKIYDYCRQRDVTVGHVHHLITSGKNRLRSLKKSQAVAPTPKQKFKKPGHPNRRKR